jgi:hypothetical protein
MAAIDYLASTVEIRAWSGVLPDLGRADERGAVCRSSSITVGGSPRP